MRDGQRVWEEFGALRINLFRVTAFHTSVGPPAAGQLVANKSPMILHEKTKKAGSHMVQYVGPVFTEIHHTDRDKD